MAKEVRVRFAPSPTGFLHIGGVRTALFNYLFAKKNGGKFILRLEDTDRERYIEAGVEQIVHSLRWLGLEPNEGFWLPEEKGKHRPYVQSKRLAQYQQIIKKLLQAGLAYYSPTTPQRLDELRQEAKKAKRAFLYRKRLDKNNTQSNTVDVPIRLDVEAVAKEIGKEISWHDEVRGDFSNRLELVEDFILIKSDGYPTYNFANVVDDHAMEISHVIRGDEFISSTAKHAMLYDLMAWPRPLFAHLPVINGPDGKKLSKRTGDTDVLEYRSKGYMPEALLNFLALLGWNDATEKEVFNLNELVQTFSLERVHKSPAVFDSKRLNWINAYYIRNASFEELLQRSEGFWPKTAEGYDLDYKKRVLHVVQERLERFDQLPELTSYFFELPTPSSKVIKELVHLFRNEEHTLRGWLELVKKLIIDAPSTEIAKLEELLRDAVTKSGGKPAALFGGLRIALTQAKQTPPIWEIIFVLQKEEALKRIDAIIKML